MDIDQAISQVEQYILSNQKSQARALLKDIIRQYPEREEVWLLSAQVSDQPGQVLYCLTKALKINPNSAKIQELVSKAQPHISTTSDVVIESFRSIEPKLEIGQTTHPDTPGSNPTNSRPLSPVQAHASVEQEGTEETIAVELEREARILPNNGRKQKQDRYQAKWWLVIPVILGIVIYFLGLASIKEEFELVGRWVASIVCYLWLIRGAVGGIMLANKKLRGGGGWILVLLPIVLFAAYLFVMGVFGEFSYAWGKNARYSRKKCPQCRSWIPWDASRCQHCGQTVAIDTPHEKSEMRQKTSPRVMETSKSVTPAVRVPQTPQKTPPPVRQTTKIVDPPQRPPKESQTVSHPNEQNNVKHPLETYGRRWLVWLAIPAGLCLLVMLAVTAISLAGKLPELLHVGTRHITSENAGQVQELTRLGTGRIEEIAYSPDGIMLAVASSTGIYMYNPTTLQLIRYIDTGSWITSIAFSNDGMTLASGSIDGSIQLWQISDNALLETVRGNGEEITSLVFSPDGQTLASGSLDGTIRLISMRAAAAFDILDGHTGAVLSLAISPDGQILASGSGGNSIHLWDMNDGSLITTLEAHNDLVQSLVFAPDGSALASTTGYDLHLWRAEDGFVTTIVGNPAFSGLAFSPNGRYLVSGLEDANIQFWEVADGLIVSSWETPTEYSVRSLVFSADGQTLAGITSENAVELWRVSDGLLLRRLEFIESLTTNLAFSPDSRTLVSSSRDSSIRFWDVSEGLLMKSVEVDRHSEVISLAYSSDGTTLDSLTRNGIIRVWRVSDGTLLDTIGDGTAQTLAAAFSPDGKYVAIVRTFDAIEVRSVSDGFLIKTLDGQLFDITSVAFSPDGNLLAAGTRDGTISVWKLSDSLPLATWEGHLIETRSLAFSPNGKFLASGSANGTIRLFSVQDGTLLDTLEGEAYPAPTNINFSPDGNILAFGTVDGVIQLFSVPEGTLLASLRGHHNAVMTVTFSSDGSRLASGSADGTIYLWGVPNK